MENLPKLTSKMTTYKEDLHSRYWVYQGSFVPHDHRFDPLYTLEKGPPVFFTHQAQHNVIVNSLATVGEVSRLLSLVSVPDRHKWFRSMNSSQALAQSVFGNLAIYEQLGYLSELCADEGKPLFGEAQVSSTNFSMEHRIKHLGERRSTSLDGFIFGAYQVAIECKFTEADVGACSRPLLTPSDSNYEKDYCDGSYSVQRERRTQCSLTESGALYWEYVPALFKWRSDIDHRPCPLNKNYQLVRNILAVCVRPDGTVCPDYGHVVLVYDERNPSFQEGGAGLLAYNEIRCALLNADLLRKCSWQRIVKHLKAKNVLPWLTLQLGLKYGLE